MERTFFTIGAAGLLATSAAAQDAPAYSYDYAGQSMALTGSAIDGAALGTTARGQVQARQRTARPARRSPTAKPSDAQTRAACSVSTPMLRSMGLPPAAECR